MTVSRFNTGHLVLLATAALFGFAFIFQRHAALTVGSMWFITWRFFVGTLSLTVCWWILRQQKPRQDYGRWVVYGVLGGVLMFLGMIAQQWGLAHTTAGKSGFITGLYVVLVPIIGLLFGLRASRATIFAVFLAAVGLLCFAGIHSNDAATNWNIGDSVTLLGALCWAFQVLWMGFAVRRCDILSFSIVQLLVVTLLAFLWLALDTGIGSLFDGQLLRYTFWDILFTGVGSSALAFLLQAVGQRRVPAAHAAIILSFESIFALFFGWFFLGETVTAMMLLGCSFLFVAMLVAQYDDVVT